MSALVRDLAGAGATVLFSSHQLDLVEHLCEDVVIIDHGRIVLAGDLDELRDKVAKRFVDVRFRGTTPDWTTIDAVDIVHAEDGHARLRLERGIELARVVELVERTARIESFSYAPPTLSELFQQAVTA
jgi:ABC-2 type transport system ATP-binding protein